MTQGLITALIVAGCAVYVLWRLLLPAVARRRILRALGRQPAAAATCGGCHGCDGPIATTKPSATQAVHWMPRRRG